MIDAYLYLKMIFGQGNNHLSLIGNITKDLMIGGIFLKAFEGRIRKIIPSPRIYKALVILFGISYIAGTLLIGELAVRYKVIDKENSLNQKYNPEIQQLLKNG